MSFRAAVAVTALLFTSIQDTPGNERELQPAIVARDAQRVSVWVRAHPTLVHRDVRQHVEAWLSAREEGPERQARLQRDELVFLAAALSENRSAQLLETVLAWRAPEHERYIDLRAWLRQVAGNPESPVPAELEELRAEVEALGVAGIFVRELGQLGRRMSTTGSQDEGFELVAWSGRESRRVGDLWTEAWSESWCGQNSWQRGRLRAAAQHLERAAELEETLGDAALRVSIYCDIAQIVFTLSEFETGLGWLDRAEGIARELPDKSSLCSVLLVRAGLHMQLGEHERALEISLALGPGEVDSTSSSVPAGVQGLASGRNLVRADLVSANTLSDLGRFESALTFATRALELSENPAVQQEAPLLALEARLTRGLLLSDVGRHAEGLRELEQVRVEFAARGDLRGVAWARKNEGWVHLELGNRERAIDALDAARAFGQETREPFLEGLCALGVAEALVHGLRTTEGLDEPRIATALKTAEAYARRTNELQLLWRAATVRGRVFALRGELESALAQFARAVDGIERWRRRIASPALLVHALRPRTDPYVEAAFAAGRLGLADEALRLTELLHARALFERAGAGRSRQTDRESFAALRGEIARIEHGLREANADSETQARQRAELRRLEEDLDGRLLAAEVSWRGGSALPSDVGPAIPDRPAWSSALPANELDLLLDYLVGPHSTLIFTLDADGVQLREVPATEATLRAAIRSVREPIERLKKGEVDLAHLDFDVEAARWLYETLIAPALPRPGVSLGIVPDGPLTSLPFELLVAGGVQTPFDPTRAFGHLSALRFLGEVHPITYLSSLASLNVSAPSTASLRRLTLLLPPAGIGVPLGSMEAATIRAAFGTDRVQVIENTTPQDLEHLAESAAAGTGLHVVAHGVFDPAAPSLGHLILGSDDASEPFARLEAWQVEQLSLSTPLVVLSACHSAEGAWLSGEGLLGLTRAFIAGGARQVIASLWAVDDAATVRYMQEFYVALGNGSSVPRAMLAARRSVRAGEDGRDAGGHPYLWAGWILQR